MPSPDVELETLPNSPAKAVEYFRERFPDIEWDGPPEKRALTEAQRKGLAKANVALGRSQEIDSDAGGSYRDEPIAVAIQQTADRVIVHWHVDGDELAAVARMRELLSGTPFWMGEEGEAVL